MAGPEVFIPAIREGKDPGLERRAAEDYKGFSAPYRGLTDEGYNGMRRFPLSIPVDDYDTGNGAAQTLHYRTLLGWKGGVHFIWGCTDNTFPEAWGRKWADQMNARFDGLADAHHFLQNTHGEKIVELILDEKR